MSPGIPFHDRVDPCDTALASESSLDKDWLRPEDDAAWTKIVKKRLTTPQRFRPVRG